MNEIFLMNRRGRRGRREREERDKEGVDESLKFVFLLSFFPMTKTLEKT
jgi:hypothetical protein